MLKRIGNHQGITVAEVIFAIAILGFVSAAILGGLQAGIVGSRDSDVIADASDVARALIENVKDTPYDNVTDISWRQYDPSPRFEYMQEIETLSDPPATRDYKQITVSVRLTGHTDTIAILVTYLIKGGI